jgi:hypothetical protein
LDSTLKLQLLALAATVAASGCFGTKAGSYRVFSDDLQRCVGKPYAACRLFYTHALKDHKVQEVRLVNGNVEFRHLLDWKGTVRANEKPCSVTTEVDPKTELIVAASSEGEGCWRPY